VIDRIGAAIAAHRFNFGNEEEFQRGIAEAFKTMGIEYRREVVLTGKDRIDFMLADGLGVEVKIDGSISALTRQLHRYAQLEALKTLVVVVGRVRLTNLPSVMNGKSVHVIAVLRAF
jgi:hypothetical protein